MLDPRKKGVSLGGLPVASAQNCCKRQLLAAERRNVEPKCSRSPRLKSAASVSQEVHHNFLSLLHAATAA